MGGWLRDCPSKQVNSLVLHRCLRVFIIEPQALLEGQIPACQDVRVADTRAKKVPDSNRATSVLFHLSSWELGTRWCPSEAHCPTGCDGSIAYGPTRELEIGGSGDQGQPWLISEFVDSLGYCLTEKKKSKAVLICCTG